MLIAGAWHGDLWGFVVWGAIHGLALIAHRLTVAVSDRLPPLQSFWSSVPGTLVAWALTQFTVFFSWIFFRLPNLENVGLAMRRLFGQSADVQFAQKVYLDSFGLNRPEIVLLLCGLFALMGVAYAMQRRLKLQISWPIKVFLLPICFYLAWTLAPDAATPYIYFEF